MGTIRTLLLISIISLVLFQFWIMITFSYETWKEDRIQKKKLIVGTERDNAAEIMKSSLTNEALARRLDTR